MTGSLIATTIAAAYMNKCRRKLEEAEAKAEEAKRLRAKYQKQVNDYLEQKDVLTKVAVGTGAAGEYLAPVPGVTFDVKIQVGNLTGKKMSVQTVVTIHNGSDRQIALRGINIKARTAFGVPFYAGGGKVPYQPIWFYDGGENSFYNAAAWNLAPGKSWEIKMAASPQIEIFSKDNMKRLREYVANAAGYKYWSSFVLDNQENIVREDRDFTIANGITLDEILFLYAWQLDSGEWVISQGVTKYDKPKEEDSFYKQWASRKDMKYGDLEVIVGYWDPARIWDQVKIALFG